ncbi:hypothetical protein ACQU0X_32695 [Pseudovibrio ascidiaceicola]|uniref:hypothetical protein n=1 Tax=Pseudovibrio ascidiaceicola TaxID=285279 RepID=UPI003D360F2D
MGGTATNCSVGSSDRKVIVEKIIIDFSVFDEAVSGVGYIKDSTELMVDARKRAAVAEQIDMSAVLTRYQKETGFSTDVVKAQQRELLRFLSLSAVVIRVGKSYGMAGAIDELWHTFVIFTRNYAQFCKQVAGCFLHHVPDTGGAICCKIPCQ